MKNTDFFDESPTRVSGDHRTIRQPAGHTQYRSMIAGQDQVVITKGMFPEEVHGGSRQMNFDLRTAGRR